MKLVFLDGPNAFPVRQFYIPKFQVFTVSGVGAGSYDIRHRDLESGSLSRSESFMLEERRTSDGVTFSTIRMTLYKVENGNTESFKLDESEF